MKKIKKGLNVKIMSLLIIVLFIFNSTASYGITAYDKACLRTPLLGNSDKGRARLGEAISRGAQQNKSVPPLPGVLSSHEVRALKEEQIFEVRNPSLLPSLLLDWNFGILTELSSPSLIETHIFQSILGQTASGYFVVNVTNSTNQRILRVYWHKRADRSSQAFIIEGDRQIFLPGKLPHPFVTGSLIALSRDQPQAKSLRRFLTLWRNGYSNSGDHRIRIDNNLAKYISLNGRMEQFIRPRTTAFVGFLIKDDLCGLEGELRFENDRDIWLDDIKLPLQQRLERQVGITELSISCYLYWLASRDIDLGRPELQQLFNQRLAQVRSVLESSLSQANGIMALVLRDFDFAHMTPEDILAMLTQMDFFEEQARYLTYFVKEWEDRGHTLVIEKADFPQDGRIRVGNRRFTIPAPLANQVVMFKVSVPGRKGLTAASILIRRDPHDPNKFARVLTIAGDADSRIFINGRLTQSTDLDGIDMDEVREFITSTEDSQYDNRGQRKIGNIIFQVVPRTQAETFRDKLHLQIRGIIKGKGFSPQKPCELEVFDVKSRLLVRAVVEPEIDGIQIIRINGETYHVRPGETFRIFDYAPAFADALETQNILKLQEDGVIAANSQFFKIVPEALIDDIKDKLQILLIWKADKQNRLELRSTIDNKLLARIEFRGYDAILVREKGEVLLRGEAKRQQVMVFMHSPELLEWFRQFSGVQIDEPIINNEGAFDLYGHRIHVFPPFTEGARSSTFFGERVSRKEQEEFRSYLNQRIHSKSKRFGHNQNLIERTFLLDGEVLLSMYLVCDGIIQIEEGLPEPGEKRVLRKLELSNEPYNIHLKDLSLRFSQKLSQLWQEFHNRGIGDVLPIFNSL